jgi:fructose-1,6-bisphosphatase/inositol monophosphatase family enzyme
MNSPSTASLLVHRQVIPQQFSPEIFLDVAQGAVAEMLAEVRKRVFLASHKIEIKPTDGSLVGACDRESARKAHDFFSARLSDVSYRIEDLAATVGVEKIIRHLILCDPLDGTRAWTNGILTSTVISAAYDVVERGVCACIVAEIAENGRIWKSKDGHAEVSLQSTGITEPCKVWNGTLDKQSTVLIDVAHGFNRQPNSRTILTDSDAGQLVLALAQASKLMILGSNGLNQALVASSGNFGRERIAGGITTAIGGAWDVAGVHLVLNSGGTARAFACDGELVLKERNPLDVLNFDIVVYGNSTTTVNTLVNFVTQATGRTIIA